MQLLLSHMFLSFMVRTSPLSVIFERQCLVFFGEQRDFDDPGIDDLINEEPSPISGTRRARHVGGRRRDTHTAKCEHTVKHYCFILRSVKACLQISAIRNVWAVASRAIVQ